jgi:hypothetical protein
MKTRTGFVSNSSSSSFIIPYNRNFRYKKKLQLVAFGFDKSFNLYDDEYSINEMLDRLHIDLTTTPKAKVKDIIEELSGRYSSYDFPDIHKNSNSWYYKEEDSYKYTDDRLKISFHDVCLKHETLSNEYYAKRQEYHNQVPEKFRDDYKKQDKWLKAHTNYAFFEKDHSTQMNKLWEEEDKLRKKLARADFEELRKKHKRFVLLSYSDNDSRLEVALEHGGIVEKLSVDVIRISHH